MANELPEGKLSLPGGKKGSQSSALDRMETRGRKSSTEIGLTPGQAAFAFQRSRGANIKVASADVGICYATGKAWNAMDHVRAEVEKQSEMLTGELRVQATGMMGDVLETLFEKSMDKNDSDQLQSLRTLWSSVSPTFLQRLSTVEKLPEAVNTPGEESVTIGDEAEEILDDLFGENGGLPPESESKSEKDYDGVDDLMEGSEEEDKGGESDSLWADEDMI